MTDESTEFARAVYRVLASRVRAGNEDYIKGKEIVQAIKAHSQRWDRMSDVHVREAVNHMCSIGQPIASSGDGYKYATSLEEIRQTIAHRRSRIAKQMSAVQGLEKWLAAKETELHTASLFPKEDE